MVLVFFKVFFLLKSNDLTINIDVVHLNWIFIRLFHWMISFHNGLMGIWHWTAAEWTSMHVCKTSEHTSLCAVDLVINRPPPAVPCDSFVWENECESCYWKQGHMSSWETPNAVLLVRRHIKLSRSRTTMLTWQKFVKLLTVLCSYCLSITEMRVWESTGSASTAEAGTGDPYSQLILDYSSAF